MASNIIEEFTTLIDNAKSLKSKGWQFKVRNYNKVVNILKSHKDLEGDLTTNKILEILREGGMKFSGETGSTPYKSQILIKIEKILTEGSLSIELDEKSKILKTLNSIPEIGPSKSLQLYDKGVRSIEDLIKNPKLINRKQLIGLRHYKDLVLKISRNEMTIWSNSLDSLIGNLISKQYNDIKIENMELAGSYRRGYKESGDIDLYLAVNKLDKKLMFDIRDKLVEEAYLDKLDVISCGERKMMCIVKLDSKSPARHLDIFIYPKNEYAFALLFATGSGEFNIRMRNYALKNNYSLSDKGLRYKNNNGDLIHMKEIKEKLNKSEMETEQDIFRFLGLEYIQPSDRTPIVKLNKI
jgi:DNA polymerase lambda